MGWISSAITPVLFLEHLRAKRMHDRRQSAEKRAWWQRQRLYGLCTAYREECAANELMTISKQLKTPGGITKLKRLISATIPKEYRINS